MHSALRAACAATALTLSLFAEGRCVLRAQTTRLQVDIRAAGPSSLRISVRPAALNDSTFRNLALADRMYPAAAISIDAPARRIHLNVGSSSSRLAGSARARHS
ncbi:MAG TPA: hypothetical protein VH277_15865 [Gemmatimonadaceae bacterium]|nr:hypothetical protein [Gemmatimonadaceae bacterium]